MTIFIFSWLMLAWLGTMPVTELRTTLSQIGTVIYFAFFLLMPIYTSIEKSRPVPERL
jgi:ubiquinol-cytochrome c reductase cytochrome b subunit